MSESNSGAWIIHPLQKRWWPHTFLRFAEQLGFRTARRLGNGCELCHRQRSTRGPAARELLLRKYVSGKTRHTAAGDKTSTTDISVVNMEYIPRDYGWFQSHQQMEQPCNSSCRSSPSLRVETYRGATDGQCRGNLTQITSRRWKLVAETINQSGKAVEAVPQNLTPDTWKNFQIS